MTPNAEPKRERVAPLRLVTPAPPTAAPILHNERAESALIGTVFHKPELYPTLSTLVQPADFYSLLNGYIWWACEQTYPNIDNLTIADALKGKYDNPDALDQHINALIAAVPDLENAESYARMVRECAVRIRIANAAHEMQAVVADKTLSLTAQIDACNLLLFKASEQTTGQIDTSARAMIDALFDELESSEDAPGCSFGFGSMDAEMKRIYAGEVALLVGHPGMGKTTFLLSAVRNNLNAGNRVVMYSLDNMPRLDIIRILAGMQTGVHKNALLERRLTPDQMADVVRYAQQMADWQLDVVDDYPMLSPTQLRRSLRKFIHDYGSVDLVVIDGLWLMEADEPTKDRWRDVHHITTELMRLAKQEFGVPILMTHQYTQEAKDRKDKRPIINDVAESAAVQRNIPLILGMYRANYYDRETAEDTTEIHIMKDRKRGKQGAMFPFGYTQGRFEETRNVSLE